MSEERTGDLAVSGARLHWRLRGSGPLLLILQGGDGTAEGMDAMTDRLVDRHQILTYDRRGLARSPLDDASAAARELATHADDAAWLLASLTREPALVFGASIGALIGLELLARHPEQVRALVAHEPPATELLPDAERDAADADRREVLDVYEREGVLPALRKAMAGMSLEEWEPGAAPPAPSPERAVNLRFWLEHDAPAALRHRLDLDALAPLADRVVPAAGAGSRTLFTGGCAEQLAARLGQALVELPGGHNGFVTHPNAFGARLGEVLDGASR
jgi:pimeloyl-ACP methyl ester carboxylesterase